MEIQRPVAVDRQNNPGMWNAPKLALQPRAGIAIRVDDKTAIRAGYARYTIPTEFNLSGFTGFETVSFLEPPYFGVTSYQNTAPLLARRSAADVCNPSRLESADADHRKSRGIETSDGARTALCCGTSRTSRRPYQRPAQYFNSSIRCRARLIVMRTFFIEFGHKLYNQNLNMIDPQHPVQYQNSLNQEVANPFYHYLDQTLMPGPLHNQETGVARSLLVPTRSTRALRNSAIAARVNDTFTRTQGTEGVQQGLELPVRLRVHS